MNKKVDEQTKKAKKTERTRKELYITNNAINNEM